MYIYIHTHAHTYNPMATLKAVNCSYYICRAPQTAAGDGQAVFTIRDNASFAAHGMCVTCTLSFSFPVVHTPLDTSPARSAKCFTGPSQQTAATVQLPLDLSVQSQLPHYFKLKNFTADHMDNCGSDFCYRETDVS